MRIDNSFSYILISYIFTVCIATDAPSEVEVQPALSECRRTSPCGATISNFPLLDPDADESSGFGSGSAPVYDEILTHEIYDLNAAPEQKNFTLCSCPDGGVCDFENVENTVKIDHHITFHSCSLESVSSICRRNTPNVRVIGKAHESGDNVQDVTAALMFCNCKSGFQRHSVEAWSGQELSVNYKCL